MIHEQIREEAARRHPLALSQYEYPAEQAAVKNFTEGAEWAHRRTTERALEYLKKMPPVFLVEFKKHMGYE